MNPSVIPTISGMVKIPQSRNQFLVSHDTKGLFGPRLGILDVRAGGPEYREIEIHDWPLNEPLPNDVEGICAIPNRPREYLMVESGFYKMQFGRVIRIRYPGKSISGAEYLASFKPFSCPDGGTTPRQEELEGIALLGVRDKTVLLLARRGGKENPEDPKASAIPGKLIWGMIDIDAAKPQFETPESAPLTYERIADRGAADLYVKEVAANRWNIFSVATSDPGDFGPFRSAVYFAGTLEELPAGITFTAAAGDAIVYWDFTGLKVEAVAAPAEISQAPEGISIATDDENYYGIWRPISKHDEPQPPSPKLLTE